LFLDLTQNINDLLRFRAKIFPDEITVVYAPVKGNEPVEIASAFSTRSERLQTSSQAHVTPTSKRRTNKNPY
jgi:hypothetical protein